MMPDELHCDRLIVCFNAWSVATDINEESDCLTINRPDKNSLYTVGCV